MEKQRLLFPAHAGVIPTDTAWSTALPAFPRARRGNPQSFTARMSLVNFPRICGAAPTLTLCLHSFSAFRF